MLAETLIYLCNFININKSHWYTFPFNSMMEGSIPIIIGHSQFSQPFKTRGPFISLFKNSEKDRTICFQPKCSYMEKNQCAYLFRVLQGTKFSSN